MEKMSRFGVGPIINLHCLGVGALFVGLRYFFPTYFSLFGLHEAIKPFAITLIIIGAAFLLWSIVSVMTAHHADTLCTTGPLLFCRHPIYSSWAVFTLPGVLLLLDTWLAVVFAVILTLVITKYGRVEEEYLHKRFGAPYDEYRKNVPAVFPIGFLFRTRKREIRKS